MAENRVCEIFNSVLKNKLNKHATEQSDKLSSVLKNYRQGNHNLMLTKSVPALDVAF